MFRPSTSDGNAAEIIMNVVTFYLQAICLKKA